MFRLGQEILKKLNSLQTEEKGIIGVIDSTPLEASRYSPYAFFHPHYGIRMSKAHIFSACGLPIYLMFSEGNEDDGKYGHFLVKKVAEMKQHIDYCLCDGGYDNAVMYAEIHEEMHAHPVIRMRYDAVIHHEAARKEIWKLVNSFWKVGGDVYAPHKKKLAFLYHLTPRDLDNPDKY